ncbi:MAG: hypothetical protein AAGK97_05965, partial [Bacteroidota bacterium]
MNHSKIYLTIAFLFSFAIAMLAQKEALPVPDSDNFFELQKKMDAYYKRNPGLKKEKHWRRFEHFYSKRVSADGDIGRYTQNVRKEHQRIQTFTSNSRAAHGEWEFIGPSAATGNSSSYGRCVRARFHPTDPDIVYVLSSSAGLWKSFDNGDSYINLTEDLPYLFATDFAVNPDDPDNIFIMTTDRKRSYFRSFQTTGFYVTFDGGNTWENRNPIPNGTFFNLSRMIMNPQNP